MIKKNIQKIISVVIFVAVVSGAFYFVTRVIAATEDIAPDATATEAGGSCTTSNAHTNLADDPDNGGDGNECTADSNSADHDIRLQFATPSIGGILDETTDAQTFKILAKRNNTGGNGTPTVALDFYCNGTLVEAGADQQLTGDAYASFSEPFTFDSGQCASDGSDVEVLVDCTPNGGGPNERSCSYEAVEWIAVTQDDTTAPTPDPMTFATAPDQVSTSSIDMTATTASDPSTPIEYHFSFQTCAQDGGTGGTDSAWQTSTSYTDSGLQANQCYGYAVAARDSVGNTTASSSVSEAYTAAEVPGAPTISNVTINSFDLTNDANGNPATNPTTNFAVQIVNTVDSTWNNQYVDTNGDPSATAVWMSDATIDALTVNGLDDDTSYDVQVKARNQDNDETAFGTATTQITVADNTPPSPDPMTFATAPDQVSTSSIDMTATTASDDSTPVEYLFSFSACAQGGGTGGTDSAWQTGTSYTDAGLQVNQCYGYAVAARDSASTTNYTASSTVSEAYTAAEVPGAPTISGVTETTFDLTNDAKGNPATNPTTNFAVQIVNTVDGTWNNQYVDTNGDPSATAVWMSDATIDALTVQGLDEGTSYDVQVKARNEDLDETAFGTATTQVTASSAPTPDPMTFATAPDEVSTTSIDMTATTASDDTTPVEYLFSFIACGINGGTGGSDSAWQTGTSYTDAGLQTNKCYGYAVAARDSVSPPNHTASSSVSEAYTAAEVPGAPTISNVTDTTFDLTNDEKGNPASSPTTNFAVQIVNTVDPTWNNQYVDTNGDPSATAVWMSDATIDALTVQGLDPSTSYDVQVKARNEDTDETAFGPATTQATDAPPPPENNDESRGIIQGGSIKIIGGILKLLD